jgi:hypothetical protein
MSNPKHFNDEHDFTNDDGYDIRDEWLNEEEEYWSERELDAADPDNYDGVDEGDETADTLDRYDEDFDWDDETPVALDYDGYNDPDNY